MSRRAKSRPRRAEFFAPPIRGHHRHITVSPFRRFGPTYALRFGKTIAKYADLLTKDQALPKRRRQHDDDEKPLNAPETVQIAKLADLYHDHS